MKRILSALTFALAIVLALSCGSEPPPPQNTPSTSPPDVSAPPPPPTPSTSPGDFPQLPGQPNPLPSPRPTPTPSPSPDFAAIDRALDALPLGSIAFNVPTMMTLNRSDDVRLLLSPSMSVEQLQKLLLEQLSRETKVEGIEVRIAPRMEARLSGTNFSILALTPEVQPVTWKEPTEWGWEVSPTEAGSQALHLTLTAILQIEGKDSTRAIRTFDRDIRVQVTWPQHISGFAAENWQWLWTTVAVPIALWVWGKRRKMQRGQLSHHEKQF